MRRRGDERSLSLNGAKQTIADVGLTLVVDTPASKVSTP